MDQEYKDHTPEELFMLFIKTLRNAESYHEQTLWDEVSRMEKEIISRMNEGWLDEQSPDRTSVKTEREAIRVCKEHHLNVQFEVNLDKLSNGDEDSSFVTVSSSPMGLYRGSDLVSAVNFYLSGN